MNRICRCGSANGSQIRLWVVVVALGLAAGGCGDDAVGDDPGDGRYPDVVDVGVVAEEDGTYRVDATISSPYDTPQRYADAWRVLAPDGTVLGVRELAHDHAGEQPFTRSLPGVEIGRDIDQVTVEGRDQVNGWGGETVTVDVPDAG